MKETENKIKVSLAALDPYIIDNIIKPTEKEVQGKDLMEWGERNIYPFYIYDLYANVPTLKTLVDACTDYIVGDNVTSNLPNLTDMEAKKLVKRLANDLMLFGGSAINVLRNRMGGIARIIPLDLRKVRTNKDNSWIYYSEDFGCKSYGRIKYTCYPKFDAEAKDIATSIYFYKDSIYTTYPTPIFAAATKACEVEKLISEYHINNLKNNFSSNYIISFNNGLPSDEMKEEIEDMINEKYSGVENSGRPMISFSQDKDHAPEVVKLDTEDWGEKYNSLKDASRQEIFTAFRCTPNLVGIPTETTGFNSQEYGDAFKVFNRTVILPYQVTICQILDDIYGTEGCITIEPYSIDFDVNGEQVEEVESNNIEEE